MQKEVLGLMLIMDILLQILELIYLLLELLYSNGELVILTKHSCL
nr:MAG TPA: hypothetical protein [Bacteriophage sp.]